MKLMIIMIRLCRLTDTLTIDHTRDGYRYVPPEVPLWTHQTGLAQRTRRETHMVLIEILTTGYAAEIIMLVVAMVPLHVAPTSTCLWFPA